MSVNHLGRKGDMFGRKTDLSFLTDTAICVSSSSLRNSPTVLRGTITPGISAAPSGRSASIRQPVPSVAGQGLATILISHVHVNN